MNSKKIIIVEDRPLFAKAPEALLAKQPPLQVEGVFSASDSLKVKPPEIPAEVLLPDINYKGVVVFFLFADIVIHKEIKQVIFLSRIMH